MDTISNASTDKTVPPTLKENQYNNSSKFAARVMIHGKYGTNKTLWPIWLFNQYQFGAEEKIIEFGCGTGLLWKVNSFRVNPSWKIELTDFSQGMIDAAKAYIGEAVPGIQYRVVDLSEYEPAGSGIHESSQITCCTMSPNVKKRFVRFTRFSSRGENCSRQPSAWIICER